MKADKYGIDMKKGVLNEGNLYRLTCVMKRAMCGEPVTVGFLGGSITQGCLKRAMPFWFISGGVKNFRDRRLLMLMQVLEEPIRNLEWQG